MEGKRSCNESDLHIDQMPNAVGNGTRHSDNDDIKTFDRFDLESANSVPVLSASAAILDTE
jgi:hypothetical protein